MIPSAWLLQEHEEYSLTNRDRRLIKYAALVVSTMPAASAQENRDVLERLAFEIRTQLEDLDNG